VPVDESALLRMLEDDDDGDDDAELVLLQLP